MSENQGWLKRESDRAQQRASSVPAQARPTVVKASFVAGRSVQGTRPSASRPTDKR